MTEYAGNNTENVKNITESGTLTLRLLIILENVPIRM
jgi:hypothetical protein